MGLHRRARGPDGFRISKAQRAARHAGNKTRSDFLLPIHDRPTLSNTLASPLWRAGGSGRPLASRVVWVGLRATGGALRRSAVMGVVGLGTEPQLSGLKELGSPSLLPPPSPPPPPAAAAAQHTCVLPAGLPGSLRSFDAADLGNSRLLTYAQASSGVAGPADGAPRHVGPVPTTAAASPRCAGLPGAARCTSSGFQPIRYAPPRHPACCRLTEAV